MARCYTCENEIPHRSSRCPHCGFDTRDYSKQGYVSRPTRRLSQPPSHAYLAQSPYQTQSDNLQVYPQGHRYLHQSSHMHSPPHGPHSHQPYMAPYPQYQQHTFSPQVHPPPELGWSVASLVLGILTLLTVCFVLWGVPATLPGFAALAGLTCGIIGLAKSPKGALSGMAIAGIIFSCIALALTVVMALMHYSMMYMWDPFYDPFLGEELIF